MPHSSFPPLYREVSRKGREKSDASQQSERRGCRRLLFCHSQLFSYLFQLSHLFIAFLLFFLLYFFHSLLRSLQLQPQFGVFFHLLITATSVFPICVVLFLTLLSSSATLRNSVQFLHECILLIQLRLQLFYLFSQSIRSFFLLFCCLHPSHRVSAIHLTSACQRGLYFSFLFLLFRPLLVFGEIGEVKHGWSEWAAIVAEKEFFFILFRYFQHCPLITEVLDVLLILMKVYEKGGGEYPKFIPGTRQLHWMRLLVSSSPYEPLIIVQHCSMCDEVRLIPRLILDSIVTCHLRPFLEIGGALAWLVVVMSWTSETIFV
mmetsp:Transcript_27060/g.69629  ORF Transcript_27060/g.69629 Transcript_27060/m.69629 type:complete len:318 (+) Transcript_27060:1718-2671(+)